MKKLTFTFLIVVSLQLSAVHAESRGSAKFVPVCEILGNPEACDGKIVRTRATVASSCEFIAIKGAGCKGAINLEYPENLDPGDGPARFTLLRDSTFQRYEAALAAKEDAPPGSEALAPSYLYDVTALFVGRIDVASKFRKGARRVGFGHLNQFPVRLVLRRVEGLRNCPAAAWCTPSVTAWPGASTGAEASTSRYPQESVSTHP